MCCEREGVSIAGFKVWSVICRVGLKCALVQLCVLECWHCWLLSDALIVSLVLVLLSVG